MCYGSSDKYIGSQYHALATTENKLSIALFSAKLVFYNAILVMKPKGIFSTFATLIFISKFKHEKTNPPINIYNSH